MAHGALPGDTEHRRRHGFRAEEREEMEVRRNGQWCAAQFRTCWNWGTYGISNEMSSTNGSRGLEFRRGAHGCGYRPRVRENFPEARDELRTQEWLRARWRGRGRVSGSKHCLHKDPKAWEKLLLLCLAFILKTMKKMEIPAKRSAPTSACICCESPGGLAEREHGQGTRDPATATRQKPVVFSRQPWAAKQQTWAKKELKLFQEWISFETSQMKNKILLT